MGAARLGTLRINLYWGAVQQSGGAPYDWSHYDQIVEAAAENGIRVLPTVYGSPPWVSRRPNLPPGKKHWADFRNFVAAAAQRYGHDGIFWAQHPNVPQVPVVWWQLWNEVNSPSFWYRKPSPKQYVRLLKKFHAGIKSGDPGARIVLSGLFPTPRFKHSMDGDLFLEGIYRNRGKRLFDATALHPYSTTPEQALDRVRDWRRTMARHKDKKAKLWLTEVGWATGGPRTALTVSRRRQATVPAPDLQAAGEEPQAVQDPRGDLVLVARHPERRNLVPVHGPVQRRPEAQARLERLHVADGRESLAWGGWGRKRRSSSEAVGTAGCFGLLNHSPKPEFAAFTRFTGGS